MIVTIGSTKGGVGKSTLAFQLALARTRAGHAAILVDCDRQKTTTLAMCVRREAMREPAQGCLFWPQARDLRDGLLTLARDFEDVVVDVGGHDSAALRAALLLTDRLLVPVQPRALDLWALNDMMLLVERALAVRQQGEHPPLRGATVLNMADPRGWDNTLTRETLATFEAIPPLAPTVMRRKAFATATAAGLAVAEQVPVDDKAAAEVAALAEAVFDVPDGRV